MGIKTTIEYADSSCNIMMGCNGCELWNPKSNTYSCYAGNITERMGGGNSGYPARFDQPVIFESRLDQALRWPDLTGTDRPDKPWLNGLPRVIFLNDMGDTFTESLPARWFDSFIPRLEASPHVWLLLTKRGKRMVQLFERIGYVPRNVWPGVSVTNNATLRRLDALEQIKAITPSSRTWCSFEPLLEDLLGLNSGMAQAVDWFVIGGESDQAQHQARSMALDWIYRLIDIAHSVNGAAFVKQLGSRLANDFEMSDKKGGTFGDFPDDLAIRQMPYYAPTRTAKLQQATLF